MDIRYENNFNPKDYELIEKDLTLPSCKKLGRKSRIEEFTKNHAKQILADMIFISKENNSANFYKRKIIEHIDMINVYKVHLPKKIPDNQYRIEKLSSIDTIFSTWKNFKNEKNPTNYKTIKQVANEIVKILPADYDPIIMPYRKPQISHSKSTGGLLTKLGITHAIELPIEEQIELTKEIDNLLK